MVSAIKLLNFCELLEGTTTTITESIEACVIIKKYWVFHICTVSELDRTYRIDATWHPGFRRDVSGFCTDQPDA